MSDKKQSIGALWTKSTKAGSDFFSGSIEINGGKHKIVVFKNSYKKEEKQPDWKIFIDDYKPEKTSAGSSNNFGQHDEPPF